MLGTLAIMGILAMVGIKAFNTAMAKHRANELIYEAQKRATTVAMQITAGNENLSVAEFPTPAGYTFGVEKNLANADQFNITLAGVTSDVCSQMKNATGVGSVIRFISEYCDKITFNNDLSSTGYTTDYANNQSACDEAGYQWCSKGDNVVVSKCSESANCCTGVSYNSQCQTCNASTGEITNKSGSCTYTYANGSTATGTCDSGICLNPSITTSTKCLTNADCGGVGSGYYCDYSTYNADTYCTEDAPTAMGCAGVSATNCAKAGKCTKIGIATRINVTGLGQLIAGPAGYWWDAKNWCEAQGKHLIPIEDFAVYRANGNLVVAGSTSTTPACTYGKTCSSWNSSPYSSMWEGDINTGETARKLTDAKANDGELYSAKYSPIVLDLAKQLRGIKNYFWTSSNCNASDYCLAFDVNIQYGHVFAPNRNLTSYFALCR